MEEKEIIEKSKEYIISEAAKFAKKVQPFYEKSSWLWMTSTGEDCIPSQTMIKKCIIKLLDHLHTFGSVETGGLQIFIKKHESKHGTRYEAGIKFIFESSKYFNEKEK